MVDATAAEFVEVAPAGAAAVDFVMDLTAWGVLLALSAVGRATGPSATPVVSAVGSAEGEVAGTVVEAMALRLANGRGCVNGGDGGDIECLGGSIGLMLRVSSVPPGWRMVP